MSGPNRRSGIDDRMTGCIKLPFFNLGEACAYVCGESAIDGYTNHAVGWVSEPFEIGFGFTHVLEGCRLAGFHVDANNFTRVRIHQVPEAAVTVLHTGLLDIWEEVDWGWLPAVPFLCHNAGRVVFAEGSLSNFRVAQFGADRFESFVGLLCPVSTAVLEHERRQRAVGLGRPGARALMAHPW